MNTKATGYVMTSGDAMEGWKWAWKSRSILFVSLAFEATRLLSIKRIWRSSKADAPRFQLERDGPSA